MCRVLSVACRVSSVVCCVPSIVCRVCAACASWSNRGVVWSLENYELPPPRPVVRGAVADTFFVNAVSLSYGANGGAFYPGIACD